jgi:hypothetical protein
MSDILRAVPRGGRVAVLCFSGSFCPVTLGHEQVASHARALLLAKRPDYHECIILMDVRSTVDVATKLSRSGQTTLSKRYREGLIKLATTASPWIGLQSELGAIQWQHPELHLERWTLGGADCAIHWEILPTDFVVLMGRPGFTETMGTKLRDVGVCKRGVLPLLALTPAHGNSRTPPSSIPTSCSAVV